MSVTKTPAATTATSAADKGFGDWLDDIISTTVPTIASTFGIDPRIAGQTASTLLSVFGIGGPGKAFTPAIQKAQAKGQLQQLVGPQYDDPAFKAALGTWLQAALEPAKAQQSGKSYQPSVDMSKSWFSDALDSVGSALEGVVDDVGSAVGSINWDDVGKIGMRVLPYAMALL